MKQDTLVYWNAYVDATTREMGSQTPFLWLDQKPERLQQVRKGQVLVSPVGKENPKPVDSGLIHDWIGAVFLSGARIEEVLSAVRDYDHYKEYYRPTIVDSRLLSSYGPCENYSMRVVNKELVAETALDMEYETCYFKIDEHRWYSITHTTRVQEVRDCAEPGEHALPPDHGSGYVWRLYTIAKFEERDEGTYVEIEAIALSRDIPVGLRWMLSPIVRRVSRNSIFTSLQQTKAAVRSAEIASRNANVPTNAERVRNENARVAAVVKGFVPTEKR